MKLFSTWLRAAMPFSSASACASVSAGGSCIGAGRAIARGTIASISARRDAAPIADSISVSSSDSMPMWRATNSVGFSRAPKGVAADISMGLPGSGVLDEFVVGRLVHQLVELAHVGDVHLEEPTVAQRVAVGERRVGA